MYERLTRKTETGYQAQPDQALERLGRLEDALERLQKEYDATLQALERLKAQNKEKTAAYRQLWANRMTLQELLFRMGCGGAKEL